MSDMSAGDLRMELAKTVLALMVAREFIAKRGHDGKCKTTYYVPAAIPPVRFDQGRCNCGYREAMGETR